MEGDGALRSVKRLEVREALDVIEMVVGQEDMVAAANPVGKLRQVVSQEPETGAAVQDQMFILVQSGRQADGVAAIGELLVGRGGNRPPDPPEVELQGFPYQPILQKEARGPPPALHKNRT